MDPKQEWSVREALLAQQQTDMASIDRKHITDEEKMSRLYDLEKNGQEVDRKLPFPKGAFFILASKFCDWFAFNGVKTILVIYLTEYLVFSAQDATVLYHGFLTIIFMMSIVGAIIADSWLGNYRTIMYMFITYAIGMVVIDLGSIPTLALPSREFTVIAVILIALGTGSMKPCIVSLGGDQFQLPQQTEQMGKYYSLHYIMLKLAYLSAAALTPVLRNDVKCFGADHCFPLAFGVPGTFVAIAFTIFLTGSPWLVKKVPTENVLVQVSKCIWSGASLSLKNRKSDSKPHWLDHAIPSHGAHLVADIKILLNVIVIYLPVCMIWTLHDQTGSRWTLQATALNGDLGFYVIKPDQVQFLMPLMVMIFIGLFNFGLSSVLHRVGINSDLRRMIAGAVLTMIAFIVAGVLELYTMPSARFGTIAYGKSVHMLWMIPQYILLGMGEAIFGPTGLRFAYNEAPESMKTVLQSCWLLTMSGGNIIALVVVSMRLFDTEAYLSFFFSALSFFDTLWFAWLIKRYKPVSRVITPN